MTERAVATASVVFVCTANQCRSPLMAAMAERLVGANGVAVASAGLLPGGVPMPARGVAVAAELGLDLGAHRSAAVDLATIGTFDLVLTAAREQARHLVADAPNLWPGVFTLKQFARWVDGRAWDREEPLREWVAARAADRNRASIVGNAQDDDIRDPMGESARVWREVAGEIDAALRGGLVPLFA